MLVIESTPASTNTSHTRSERCAQDGRSYPRGECPCWAALPEPRRSELRRDLDTWFEGFMARRSSLAAA